MSVRIRPITQADIPSFHAALAEVIAEGDFLVLTQPPSLEAVATRVKTQIAANQVHLVALDTGRVVGWCDIITPNLAGFTHSGEVGIGVIAAHRGRRLGSKLLDAAMDTAWSRGLMRVELEVFASNPIAQKLYEKAGFQVEGRRRKARFYQDKWTDMILMAQLKPGLET